MFYNRVAAWIVFSCISIYNYFSLNGSVLIEIDKGILRGRNASTWRGTSYFSFKGIPYAKPPIEELRFKAPQEETPWAGIKEAEIFGEVCPQLDMFYGVYRGQEDCLFINVYTPSLGPERLPVMVYIYGGMFKLGTGNDELYGPDYFMDAGNVVLVTFNYRLGALGFLSTGDDEVPGNAGMKDQVAALKWVRRNIANFGGDPDSVTLFGGSTGAACVHYHLLSPMSKGLFKGAISQSGSAVNAWALSLNSPQTTVRLAEALGASDVAQNKSRAVEFLKTASPRDIVEMQETLIAAATKDVCLDFLFLPTVDKGVTSEEVFLPDLPVKIIESGNFNKVPYISGYNTYEGYFFLHEMKRPETMLAAFETTERYVPTDIRDALARSNLANSMRKFYFDDRPIGHENISNFRDLYSDAIFLAGIRRAARLHVEAPRSSPIYLYIFSYDDYLNLKYIFNIDSEGAVHGDELGYLFHHRLLFWKKPEAGSPNDRVIHTMIRLWTNFAKYGNPTPDGDPLVWKPLTIGKFSYLNISGDATELQEDPDSERSSFWEKAYETYSASEGLEQLRSDSDDLGNSVNSQIERKKHQRMVGDL